MKSILHFLGIFFILISCSSDDSFNGMGSPDAPTWFEVELDWVGNFGGSGSDKAHAVISTSDGGMAVLGYSNSTDGLLTDKNLPVNDYWLLKFDADGQLQWHQTYGGSKDDRGQAIIQTSDGGYALAGYAMSSDGDGSNNEGFHDHWIVKLDAGGSIEWERSYGFAGHDHAYDLIQTADGGYFFTGFLDIVASGGQGGGKTSVSQTAHGVGEFWGTKIDSQGNLEWRKFFGGTNNDRAYGLVRSFDGGYIMAGFSESDDTDISNTKGSYDFWLVKVNDEGGLVWERSYGGSGIDVAFDIERTDDNAYVIVGHTFSTDKDISDNHGGSDAWLIKINEAGELLWENTYGGSDFDSANSVKQTSDGGYLIAGNSRSSDQDLSMNSGENDIWVIKTDSNGNMLWQNSQGGSGIDFGFDAIEQGENGIILVGQSGSPEFNSENHLGGSDLVVLRYR